MTMLINKLRNEPAAVVAAVSAVLALVGIQIAPDIAGEIVAVIAAVGTLVARSQVTPEKAAKARVNEAVAVASRRGGIDLDDAGIWSEEA